MTQVFEIDEIDRSIIKLIQKEPNLTHTQIAKKVNRSQPTIGMRIRKLEKTGVLKYQAGINIKTADLIMGIVEIDTLNPQLIENLIKNCPYLINGFRKSGNFNLSILIVGYSFQQIDRIVNNHFRNNPNVNNVTLNIITNIVNDFVLPFEFDFKQCEKTCMKICNNKFT
ncbi:MAG: Lrp/AsnC family transcriptional regulator [Candidatus Lokiarchaeota archaeon]|nr:Lrp/AsnC family transcriptional regulator [Candidatus Lokiarchaeota archaeon]